ncbi:MAG TPA: sigma factor, partial [Nocardioidaceae bacterium]|nr:sigma factor [Nocardioidaceae bacterium]
MTTRSSSDDRLAATLREESGRLVAALYRRFRDFDIAEEAVQGAVVEALTAWRRDGTPDRPAAWLTTAAQRNALDLIRRRGRQEALAARVEPSVERGGTDDRIALLFACCHPALAPEARLALTLRAVIGLT